MVFWRAVDWQRPWLAPYRALGEAVCADLEGGSSVAAALNRHAGARAPVLAAGPLRFVAHEALPEGEAYEAFIHRSVQVPTRDNLHDLFNGLVWIVFAPLKRRLNELQAAEIERLGIGATRGPVRDALTLFDENAVLWQAPPELVEALRAHAWQELFVTRRGLWSEARTTLFGHALMDKLVNPRKPITAHAWLVPQGVDAAGHLAATLTADSLAAKPFLPLPVLGVPGWWQDNADAGFYRDASVFRPARG